MSRRLASEIPPPADGFYPGERAAPAPGSGGFLPVPRAAVPLALNETARGNLEASDPALRTEDAARADDYL